MTAEQTPTCRSRSPRTDAALLACLAGAIIGIAVLLWPFFHSAPPWQWDLRAQGDLIGATTNAELISIDSRGALLGRQGQRGVISIITPLLKLPADSNRVLLIRACRPEVPAGEAGRDGGQALVADGTGRRIPLRIADPVSRQPPEEDRFQPAGLAREAVPPGRSVPRCSRYGHGQLFLTASIAAGSAHAIGLEAGQRGGTNREPQRQLHPRAANTGSLLQLLSGRGGARRGGSLWVLPHHPPSVHPAADHPGHCIGGLGVG